MSHTAVRLLSLLSLLQTREWTGVQLADRLQVSARTVRSDIERLRELGYDVQATRGGVGGYRLGTAGTSVPPLLLDGEEAVAVAVGLRTGVNCIIGGMEEASLRALGKLEQVLPTPLRHRVRNLNRYTVPMPATRPVPVVDPELLTQLAGLCHSQERLRFWYEPSDQEPASDGHDVEPYRLINRGHRWYLLGYDVHRCAWQAYEVSSIRPRTPTGPRFTARELPGDAEVTASVPAQRWRHEATVRVHAAAAHVRHAILPAEGVVTPIDDRSCLLRIGAESISAIALILGRLDAGFTVDSPVELVEQIRTLAERYTRAAPSGPARSRTGPPGDQPGRDAVSRSVQPMSG